MILGAQTQNDTITPPKQVHDLEQAQRQPTEVNFNQLFSNGTEHQCTCGYDLSYWQRTSDFAIL
jgi:hypothetical protein